MLYVILTLFFLSLFGIIFMIGRKMLLIDKGYVFEESRITEEELLAELKYKSQIIVKSVGYAIVVGLMRLYLRLTNLIKNSYRLTAFKIKKVYVKKAEEGRVDAEEVSKFLKMVGEYKKKLRRIKRRIKEEENL